MKINHLQKQLSFGNKRLKIFQIGYLLLTDKISDKN